MVNKKFQDVKVGDFITRPVDNWINRGHLLAKVTKVTKTQVTAEVIPSGDYTGGYQVRISKRTGKEMGTRPAFWKITDDPEEIHRLNREAQRLARQRIEEQQRREAERLAAVKAANPSLEPTVLTMGVRMLEWRDSKGRWNVLFYVVSEYVVGDDRVGVVIHPTNYGPNNYSEGFSIPSSQLGDSEEDAVLKLLAREF